MHIILDWSPSLLLAVALHIQFGTEFRICIGLTGLPIELAFGWGGPQFHSCAGHNSPYILEMGPHAGTYATSQARPWFLAVHCHQSHNGIQQVIFFQIGRQLGVRFRGYLGFVSQGGLRTVYRIWHNWKRQFPRWFLEQGPNILALERSKIGFLAYPTPGSRGVSSQ